MLLICDLVFEMGLGLGHHTLGNIVVATLETTKGHLMNLIITMRFIRGFFEVSSVAAAMLPSVWWP